MACDNLIGINAFHISSLELIPAIPDGNYPSGNMTTIVRGDCHKVIIHMAGGETYQSNFEKYEEADDYYHELTRMSRSPIFYSDPTLQKIPS